VFASVGKTRDELALAVGHGVTVHVESADELAALQAVAAGLGRPARFAIRVNPDVEVDTHASIQTGHDEAKFGVPVAVAHELLATAAAGGLPRARSGPRRSLRGGGPAHTMAARDPEGILPEAVDPIR
jgi:diaminopimelate decarboxylase